jgi:hypothetical protein
MPMRMTKRGPSKMVTGTLSENPETARMASFGDPGRQQSLPRTGLLVRPLLSLSQPLSALVTRLLPCGSLGRCGLHACPRTTNRRAGAGTYYRKTAPAYCS